MQLVDVLVQRTPVQSAVRPVVEHVLKHEEERDLRRHDRKGREGDLVRRHAEVAADGVEEVDQGELAGEVGEEDDLCALEDLSAGDGFVLRRGEASVKSNPIQASGEEARAFGGSRRK
jgi:hypothetical protein